MTTEEKLNNYSRYNSLSFIYMKAWGGHEGIL